MAGTNIQIPESEGSFIISATAPPVLVSNRLSGPDGSLADALVVDASGRVGIGTEHAHQTLDVLVDENRITVRVKHHEAGGSRGIVVRF